MTTCALHTHTATTKGGTFGVMHAGFVFDMQQYQRFQYVTHRNKEKPQVCNFKFRQVGRNERSAGQTIGCYKNHCRNETEDGQFTGDLFDDDECSTSASGFPGRHVVFEIVERDLEENGQGD